MTGSFRLIFKSKFCSDPFCFSTFAAFLEFRPWHHQHCVCSAVRACSFGGGRSLARVWFHMYLQQPPKIHLHETGLSREPHFTRPPSADPLPLNLARNHKVLWVFVLDADLANMMELRRGGPHKIPPLFGLRRQHSGRVLGGGAGFGVLLGMTVV